jgi:hypothetical protein
MVRKTRWSRNGGGPDDPVPSDVEKNGQVVMAQGTKPSLFKRFKNSLTRTPTILSIEIGKPFCDGIYDPVGGEDGWINKTIQELNSHGILSTTTSDFMLRYVANVSRRLGNLLSDYQKPMIAEGETFQLERYIILLKLNELFRDHLKENKIPHIENGIYIDYPHIWSNITPGFYCSYFGGKNNSRSKIIADEYSDRDKTHVDPGILYACSSLDSCRPVYNIKTWCNENDIMSSDANAMSRKGRMTFATIFLKFETNERINNMPFISNSLISRKNWKAYHVIQLIERTDGDRILNNLYSKPEMENLNNVVEILKKEKDDAVKAAEKEIVSERIKWTAENKAKEKKEAENKAKEKTIAAKPSAVTQGEFLGPAAHAAANVLASFGNMGGKPPPKKNTKKGRRKQASKTKRNRRH